MRGGLAPLHRMPNSVHRKEASGPSASVGLTWVGSNSFDAGGAEQSSSLVMKMTARNALSRKKPLLPGGGGSIIIGSPSAARAADSECSKPHPFAPTCAMQVNTSEMS